MAKKTLNKTDTPQTVERTVHEYIGTQMRSLRIANGLSQKAIGEEVSVSLQQIQKYEHHGRISPGKLYILAHAFQVPVGLFFPDEGELDYKPLPPRLLTIMRKLTAVADIYPEELTAITNVLVRMAKKAALPEQE